MPQSLLKIYLHIIFSTQDRKPLLFQKLQEELYSYLASAYNAHGSFAVKIGGTTNHVHVAATLPRTISVSKLLEEIKKSSSKWIKTKDTRLKNIIYYLL